MYDVVALGELLIDFAQQSVDGSGYPTMAAHPGGAPGNFLAALNKYGARTAFLGKVGEDTFGRLLLNTDPSLADLEAESPRIIPWWLRDPAFCGGYVYDESLTLRENLRAMAALVE